MLLRTFGRGLGVIYSAEGRVLRIRLVKCFNELEAQQQHTGTDPDEDGQGNSYRTNLSSSRDEDLEKVTLESEERGPGTEEGPARNLSSSRDEYLGALGRHIRSASGRLTVTCHGGQCI